VQDYTATKIWRYFKTLASYQKIIASPLLDGFGGSKKESFFA